MNTSLVVCLIDSRGMPLEAKVFVFVERQNELLVFSQEKENSSFKRSNRFLVFLSHSVQDPKSGEQWWFKGEAAANCWVLVLLLTPSPAIRETAVTGWSEGALMLGMTAHWSLSICGRPRITCAWLPSTSPWLLGPAGEPYHGSFKEQREGSCWILGIYLLWPPHQI